MTLNSIKIYWTGFFKSKRGKTIVKWAQRIFLLAMIGWLLSQLTEIGWLKVWHSLPTSPVFYILFILIYLSLPIADMIIYRMRWVFDVKKYIHIFILKKVYNVDVMGYSGEVFFYFWARKNLDIKDGEILKTIKDNNIISSIASTLVAFLLLSTFLFTGQIHLLDWFKHQNAIFIYAGIIFLVILVALAIRFRRVVISMPMKTAGVIFLIHCFRLLLGQTMQVTQWYLIMPNVPFYVWFTFVSIQIVMTRIPFLPNRDLIFMGTSIKLTQMMHIPSAQIAAIILVNTVLGKLLNFSIFSLASLFKDSEMIPTPELDGLRDLTLGSQDKAGN